MKISKIVVQPLIQSRSPEAIPYRLTPSSVESIAIALMLGEEDQSKLAAQPLCFDVPQPGEHAVRLRHVNFYRSAESAHDPDAYTCQLSLIVFGQFCTISLHVTGISERMDMADPSQQLSAVMQIDCYTDSEREANDAAQRAAFEAQMEQRRIEEQEADRIPGGVHHCQMGATSIRVGVRAARALLSTAKPNERLVLAVPPLLADAFDGAGNFQLVIYNDETGEWPKSEVRGRTNDTAILILAHKVIDKRVEAHLEELRVALTNTLLTEGGDAFVIYL